LALTAASPAASNEMQVLQSNVPSIPVGTKIAADPTSTLKSGEEVRVLVLATNQTKVFRGSIPARSQTGGTRGITLPQK
jgi:hypothetical protein